MNHIDAIDRAGLHAQVTARALAGDHGMHLFCRAKDGVYRTGLNTLGATDTFILSNVGDRGCICLFPVLLVEGQWLHVEQVSQGLYTGFSARGALVDIFPIGDGLSVGAATGITTLTTLGLGQDIVNLIRDRVALGFEMDSGKAKQGSEGGCHAYQSKQSTEQRKL